MTAVIRIYWLYLWCCPGTDDSGNQNILASHLWCCLGTDDSGNQNILALSVVLSRY